MKLFYIVYQFNSIRTATYIKAHDEDEMKQRFQNRIGSLDRIISVEEIKEVLHV